MTITVELPVDACGKHYIKFYGADVVEGRYFVRRYTFGEFKLTVYYDTNRYVEIDFLRCTVRFDYSIGAEYSIFYYSHFRRDNKYIFQCQEIDLFNPRPEYEEDEIPF